MIWLQIYFGIALVGGHGNTPICCTILFMVQGGISLMKNTNI